MKVLVLFAGGKSQPFFGRYIQRYRIFDTDKKTGSLIGDFDFDEGISGPVLQCQNDFHEGSLLCHLQPFRSHERHHQRHHHRPSYALVGSLAQCPLDYGLGLMHSFLLYDDSFDHLLT